MTLYTNEGIQPPPPAPNPQELLAAKSGGYRYGFNGKEKDDEIKGSGVQYDYGFRVYDARLGKFLSIDPLSSKFPYYSPFQFAGNKPIVAIDLDGLEEFWSHSWTQSDGSVRSELVPLRNEDGSPHVGNQMAFNNYCRTMGINTSVIPSDAIVASHDDYVNGVDVMRGYVVQNAAVEINGYNIFESTWNSLSQGFQDVNYWMNTSGHPDYGHELEDLFQSMDISIEGSVRIGMTEYFINTGIYSTNPNTAELYFTTGQSILFGTNKNGLDFNLGASMNMHTQNKFVDIDGMTTDVTANVSTEFKFYALGAKLETEKSLTSGQSNTTFGVGTGVKTSSAKVEGKVTTQYTTRTMEH